MITNLHIRDFQSLEDLDLPLGDLTVLTGASNSGKSAVFRAMRTLAHNSTSTDFVRAGSKVAKVSARLDNELDVTIERGSGHSYYEIASANGVEEYPKAGTSVPVDLAKILAFEELEGQSVNFATQFDRPFLLDWPATQVAKALGSLTNVTVIYEGVREAERRRKAIRRLAKTRRADVESLRGSLTRFDGLDGDLDVLAEVEKAVAMSDRTAEASKRVTAVCDEIEILQRELTSAQTVLGEVPEVDFAGVSKVVAAHVAVLSAVAAHDEAQQELDSATTQHDRMGMALELAKENYHEALHSMGTCPTCGQEIA